MSFPQAEFVPKSDVVWVPQFAYVAWFWRIGITHAHKQTGLTQLAQAIAKI